MPNTDLHDLDPEKVLDAVNEKMRKDLAKAHQLASEFHPLSYYKEVLQKFQEEALLQAEALAAKKSKTSKPSTDTEVDDEDGDVDMADAADEAVPPKEKKSKKRKAEDEAAVSLLPATRPPCHMMLPIP